MGTSANLGVDKPPWNAEFCWRDASPQNEASLQHSSGQRSRSGAHRNLCCWRKASWRCTPSPETLAAACHVGMYADQLIGLSESHSIDFAQGSGHQPSAWTGELPSTSRSGKGEHRRHIITTGQTLSVSTSTFSLHLQLECSTKSLSTS